MAQEGKHQDRVRITPWPLQPADPRQDPGAGGELRGLPARPVATAYVASLLGLERPEFRVDVAAPRRAANF